MIIDVKELRAAERFLLNEPLVGSFGISPIFVVDIGELGARIEHAQPLRLATTSRLWFKRGDAAVSTQAIVMWSHLSKTPNDEGKYLYQSGLRLEDVPEDFASVLLSLVESGVARRDVESLERKRQRLIERELEKTSKVTMKVLRTDADVSPDQMLLIQHARERLRLNPDEAVKWYNRAKFAISTDSAHLPTELIPHRDDVLAIWEYLERSVELSTIVRVFEKRA